MDIFCSKPVGQGRIPLLVPDILILAAHQLALDSRPLRPVPELSH